MKRKAFLLFEVAIYNLPSEAFKVLNVVDFIHCEIGTSFHWKSRLKNLFVKLKGTILSISITFHISVHSEEQSCFQLLSEIFSIQFTINTSDFDLFSYFQRRDDYLFIHFEFKNVFT